MSIVPFRQMVYAAAAKTYEVRVYSFDGALRRIIRVTEPPKPISDKEWRRKAEGTIPRGTPAAERAERIARIMAMPRPEAYPAHSRMRVDGAEQIWIQDYEPDITWTVFDSVGTVLGRVELSFSGQRPRPRLADIGTDHMW